MGSQCVDKAMLIRGNLKERSEKRRWDAETSGPAPKSCGESSHATELLMGEYAAQAREGAMHDVMARECARNSALVNFDRNFLPAASCLRPCG